MDDSPKPRPTYTCRCGYPLLRNQDCPECGLLFDRAIIHPIKPPLWQTASFVAIVLVTINLTVMSHGQNQLGWPALPFSIMATGLAWWPYIGGRKEGWSKRIFVAFAAIVATFMLVKNVSDMIVVS